MRGHPSIIGDETESQRRRRSRRALLIALMAIAIVFALALLPPAIAAVRVWSDVRRIDAGFARIERGMAASRVRVIMLKVDAGTLRATPHNGAWWMNQPLPAAETARIKSTDTWRPGLLPFLRYEVTYDAAGRVVGKRRYD